MAFESLRCGLLGRTLGHSYSPAIHKELAGYSYRLFEVEPEQLGSFLTSGAFDGLNVTIPYKKDVIPYCAGLSETARAIGAVNAIVRRPTPMALPCSCRPAARMSEGKRCASSAAAARRSRRSMS